MKRSQKRKTKPAEAPPPVKAPRFEPLTWPVFEVEIKDGKARPRPTLPGRIRFHSDPESDRELLSPEEVAARFGRSALEWEREWSSIFERYVPLLQASVGELEGKVLDRDGRPIEIGDVVIDLAAGDSGGRVVGIFAPIVVFQELNGRNNAQDANDLRVIAAGTAVV